MIRFHEHDGKLYRHESEAAGLAAVWHRDGWRTVEHVPPQAKSLSARTAAARTGGRHEEPESSFADIAEPVTVTLSAEVQEIVDVVFPEPPPPTAKPKKKKAAKKRAKKKAARKKRTK